MHTFLTDRWYDLQVLDVEVGSEVGMGSCRDRVDVVFLANERRSSGGEGPGHRGRPKACITLYFEPGWRPEDDGTLTLLNYLGVRSRSPTTSIGSGSWPIGGSRGSSTRHPGPAHGISSATRGHSIRRRRQSRAGCPGVGSGTRVAPYRALSQCEAPLGRCPPRPHLETRPWGPMPTWRRIRR